jgi:uncharacterized protein (DUF1501 family)
MIGAGVSRRALLESCALSSLGFLLAPRGARAEAPPAEPVPQTPVLLCVFLRGGADGLSIVVPHGDAEYYRLRPSTAVPPPGEKNGAVDLDGRFGLHPRLAALKDAYDAGQLAIVHAAGSPHPTRSHFQAQDYMTTGAVGDRRVARGWLTHYLASRTPAGSDLLRAVALVDRPPLSLRGYPSPIITPTLAEFRFDASEQLSPLLEQGFRKLYRSDSPSVAERAGQRALEASVGVARALRQQKNRARYSRDVRQFAELARLIKADVGLEVAWLDMGGWDTHRYQGSTERGDLPRQIERLGRALSAFRADLGDAFERVVVVVMSEFGRTARENGTGGTDHGHGSVMLVLGGNVKGGRVLGNFPGLMPEQLFEARDLAVTTDFRDVLGELCERHLGHPHGAALFPGYALEESRRLGLLG